jgi:phosphomannomutase
MKKLIVFDLDGTLAPSKSAIDEGMARLLDQLLKVVKVAVISGGGWPQFQKQLLAHLSEGDGLKNLSLLPTCGTKFFQYGESWKELYSEDFTTSERTTIMAALNQAVDKAGNKPAKVWGAVLEDRGSQITFSALGQQAPLDEKSKWDPDFKKRKAILAILTPSLPGFSVHMGGSTSIDVTKPGIDKGYGIHKLRDTLGISIGEMIFVGDALFPGGNDYPSMQAGAFAIRVDGPGESKKVIEAVIGCLGQMAQPDSSETSQ